jgi:serine/threonine protein kinase
MPMTEMSTDEWRSLSEHLDQALDLPEDSRAAWLDALALKDPAMAQRIAHAFALRAQAGFSGFLSGPSSIVIDQDSAATLTGRPIGPYVIETEIGRGGMGSVWRARRADGRYQGSVAIKFVHASWMGGAAEQRFRIEGNLLGRLDHPHIARLLDAGVLDGTQPYLILEYVEGEPIDAYCERSGLDAESCVKLFIDALDAVAHAHSHLIVHRDIKPANIFVTHTGAVKLLDFGIAKLLDDDSGRALTRSGAIALTPQYAAPEQLLGQPVSTATDVYALGLVLYVLLTGSHAIAVESPSNAAYIQAALTEIPPQASTVARRPAIPGRALEGDLNNILHKALKKEPGERYASVGAFSDDLQRYLTHQPVHARADTLGYRTQKFVRRHRGGVTAALLSFIAIIIGFLGMAWQAHRADVNAARALQQLSYAEASNEFLSFLLEQGSDKPFTTPELLARGVTIVKGQFKDDPATRARLLLTLADLYAEVEDKSQAHDLFVAAQTAARSVQDAALIADIDCSLAVEYADENEFEKSQTLLNATVRRVQGTPDIDRAVLADCLDKRAQVLRGRGDAAASLADAEAALAALGRPRAGQLTLALNIRTEMASANAFLGNGAAAVREYERAIDDLTQMGRGQTDFAVTLLNSLGVILSKSGQWLRAAQVYEHGLAISRSVSGGAEISPMTVVNYAKLLVDLGRGPEALPQFDAAMVAAKHRGDVNGVQMVDLLSAPAYCEIGNLDECGVRLIRSGDLLRKQLPPGHSTLGTLETEEAQLAIARGDFRTAKSHLRQALQIFASAGERNPNELRALALQTEVDLSLGDVAAAAEHSDLAVAKSRAALGGFSSSAWLGRALLVQSKVLRARNNPVEAKTKLIQAIAMLEASIGDAAPWTKAARAEFARLLIAATDPGPAKGLPPA